MKKSYIVTYHQIRQDALEAAPGRVLTRPTWTSKWYDSAAHTLWPKNAHGMMPASAERPSDNYWAADRRRTRYHTAPTPTTNVGENTGAAIEADLVICWVIFHQDDPNSYVVPTNCADRTATTDGTGDAPADQFPTETNNPKTVTLTTIGGSKSGLNHTLPTYGIGTESELYADSQKWRHVDGQFWHKQLRLGLLWAKQ